MNTLTIFLWGCLISSTVVVLGYEIWNFFIVSKDLAAVSKEAQKNKI